MNMLTFQHVCCCLLVVQCYFWWDLEFARQSDSMWRLTEMTNDAEKATGAELHGTWKAYYEKRYTCVTFCWKISLNRGVLLHWSLKLKFAVWHEHAGFSACLLLLACSPVLFLMRPRICTSVWQHVKTYWNDERLLRKPLVWNCMEHGKHTRKRDRHLVTFCWKISLNRGVLLALVIEVWKLQFVWHEHADFSACLLLLACSPVLFLMRPRICTSVWQHVKTYWNDERLLRKPLVRNCMEHGKHTTKRDTHVWLSVGR